MMKTLAKRVATIILGLALASGLAGCSAIKLGYNALPDLAWWWLDGYFDFNDTQSPQVRAELERLHAWHRERELPVLQGLLARVEQIAPGPVTGAQACGLVDEVRIRLERIAAEAEPAAAAIGASLRPRQLQHLKRKYERRNQEFRREWIEALPAQRTEKRLKQMVERAEMFYGTLDARQRALLRDGLENSVYDPQRILVERLRRQHDLLATLREMHQHPGDARRLLQGYVKRIVHSPDAEYRSWQDAWLQESCGLVAALHESTTPAQRERAMRRLQAYQRDLQELSRKGTALPAAAS